MNPYTYNMKQDATFWPLLSVNEFNRATYGAPVPIKCRCQNKTDLIRSSEGEQIISSAQVYPDRELSAKGYLYLGTSVTADPKAVSGARMILQIGDSPSLDGQYTLHKVWL